MDSSKAFPETGSIIPIFPLPATVFFPGSALPLHIFEPRYRQMVSEALEGNRWIGMVRLKPGWEADYYGKPDVQPIGCVGTIDREALLPDGKFNIRLQGLRRFRIMEEIPGKPYRLARIEIIGDIHDQSIEGDHAYKDELVGQYRKYLSLLPEGHKLKIEIHPQRYKLLSELANQIAYQLGLSTEEKQGFLETADVNERLEFLQSNLKIKTALIALSRERMGTDFDARMN